MLRVTGLWRALVKNSTCIKRSTCAPHLFGSFNEKTSFILRTRAMQLPCHSDSLLFVKWNVTWKVGFPKTSFFIEPTKTRNKMCVQLDPTSVARKIHDNLRFDIHQNPIACDILFRRKHNVSFYNARQANCLSARSESLCKIECKLEGLFESRIWWSCLQK